MIWSMFHFHRRHLWGALLLSFWIIHFIEETTPSGKTEDIISGIGFGHSKLTQGVRNSTHCLSTLTSSSHLFRHAKPALPQDYVIRSINVCPCEMSMRASSVRSLDRLPGLAESVSVELFLLKLKVIDINVFFFVYFEKGIWLQLTWVSNNDFQLLWCFRSLS